MSSPVPLVVPPGGGKVVKAFGAEMIFHLTGEQTGGRLMQATIIAPPGQVPPLHYHENEDEYFFIQEGQFSFFLNGQWHEAGPGSIVYGPRGQVHTIKNVGDTVGRVLCTSTPAGFEVFFSRCAEESAKPGGPDHERILTIAAEHGIFFVNP